MTNDHFCNVLDFAKENTVKLSSFFQKQKILRTKNKITKIFEKKIFSGNFFQISKSD